MSRGLLAIISNELTPYRLHLHRRIAVEIPELELWSVFTHESSSSPWQFGPCPEIGPKMFGAGQSVQSQGRFSRAPSEWVKGGRIIECLRGYPVRAVVVLGYNDAARLRIIFWSYKRNLPCFLFGDSNILCDARSTWRRWAKQLLLPHVIRRCSGVLHCGSLGREYFLRYGADPARLFPFPYEPDYEAVRNPPPDLIEEVRCRFRLAPERRRLIYSGRLTAVKRVDLLLHAFVAIAEERPNWDLIIAGSGELRAALESAIPVVLRKRVIWAGFVGEYSHLAALYSLADVLVLPSEYEPWGVVLTEAAVRLALVSSSVAGAAAEVLRDGINGRVFESGNLVSLIDALRDVTAEDRIDALKAASPYVLAEWRRRSDPVLGLRQALHSVGVLPCPQRVAV